MVKIKTKTAKALTNSGSSITIVSELFTRAHKLPIKPMGESETLGLISANTGPVHLFGTTEFLIRVSGLTMPVAARVAKVTPSSWELISWRLMVQRLIIN